MRPMTRDKITKRPGAATDVHLGAIEKQVRSLQTTCWPEMASRLRLRQTNSRRWIVVRSERLGGPTRPAADVESSQFHPRSDDSPPTVLATPTQAASPPSWPTNPIPTAQSASKCLAPYLDLELGVVEVGSKLIAQWRQSANAVYDRAGSNLQSELKPSVRTVTMHGCSVVFLSAGYWTSGLTFDADYLMKVLPSSADLKAKEITSLTLLSGFEHLIWCPNHGSEGLRSANIQVDYDPQKACSVIDMYQFLNNQLPSSNEFEG